MWTVDQVLALASDASSAKSGQGLATARKWQTLGQSQQCVWGEIQGSGKDPYRTAIDLSEPAFKCSCPSRKFPCKHALGLFLLLAQQPGALPELAPAPWAAEWLAHRAEKTAKKAAHQADSENQEPSAETKAKASAATEKRVAAREDKVTAGMADLKLWLSDLVRNGFTLLPSKPSSFWEIPAARLVDAQAPGLARRVRRLDGLTSTGENWPAWLLEHLALLHLACEGWARRDTLSPDTLADLRALIGFTERQEELLALSGVRDRWFVVGQIIEEEDRLRVQRSWLLGLTNRRFALCLSFAAGNQPLDVSLIAGTVFEAELVFYPSAWPVRALVKQRFSEPTPWSKEINPFPGVNVRTAYALAAEACTANPWLEQSPLVLEAVIPFDWNGTWLARDEAGDTVPLRFCEDQGWRCVSLAGGKPVSLFGEWDGQALRPLSALAKGRLIRLHDRG